MLHAPEGIGRESRSCNLHHSSHANSTLGGSAIKISERGDVPRHVLSFSERKKNVLILQLSLGVLAVFLNVDNLIRLELEGTSEVI